MIAKAIRHTLRNAREKGWKKTYWAFDIHGTLLKPNYRAGEVASQFYPKAEEIMKKISSRSDIVKILFTCSYPNEIEQYLKFFAQCGITFDYVNENPEVVDGAYGYYKSKIYFNVLFEDKAGFDGESDWAVVEEILNEMETK
jgi:hypothetical protein